MSRPPKTEVDAVNRAIEMVRRTGASVYFVHISTAGGVEAIAAAQAEGLAVSGETCTHYLVLDDAEYQREEQQAVGYVMAPPLRTTADQDALWDGLRSGALSVVSSDHCPYCLSEKNAPEHRDFRTVPNGVPGIEHRMPIIYSAGVERGTISLAEFVAITAHNPAKKFGLYPKKGVIDVGSDADILVLDTQRTTHIHAVSQRQRVDYTPYEGWTLQGQIRKVYSRGELLVESGSFVGPAGRGVYIHRDTSW